MDRPNFQKLLGELKKGDKLIVTKLDRFARTAADGGQVIQQLHARGVTIHVLNLGIIDNSTMGKLMVTMLLAFAEFERDLIVERTQAGRKFSGHMGGRPEKYTAEQRQLALQLLAEPGNSYGDVVRMTGISRSTVLRMRRKEKF